MNSKATGDTAFDDMRPVTPTLPVAPYLGGKRNLARRLTERIETIPHTTYAEAFVGMAGVFLRRRSAPKAEVINDYSRDVATFFRVIQRHYPAFRDMIRFQITTRAEFDRLTATDPKTLTDLERSARFLYLQATAFGGKVAGRTFGVTPQRPGRFDLTRLGPMLEDVHARLAGVTVECLPYDRFIPRYDRPGTLFYLDPPYWGCETDYGKGMFGRDDFARLAEILAAIQGRFLLSLNDRPALREIFAGFEQETVATRYSVKATGSTAPACELIISNV
ncbi:DNA adenine methylase [Fodinicurvata sp. EGI_FJ10296]|uniref:DNA adenine methylase n=1 Tax=Fodinicurvata sp. EGI_FJ10296 TaxID=3231908 RepID=UPI003451429F